MPLVEGSPNLTADRPVLHRAAVDTTELRWFAGGQLPPDIRSWFTHDGAAGMIEERCDIYRLDGRRDIGFKLRSGSTPELKVRQSIGEPFTIDTDLAGRPEVWRKWSPAGGLVEFDEQTRWVDVHKTVTKRRFSMDGDERVIDDRTQPIGAGCDVEIAAVTVEDIKSWTFAFAAFGPTARRRHAVVAAWRALLAGRACPDGLARTFAPASGYPTWLALSHR